MKRIILNIIIMCAVSAILGCAKNPAADTAQAVQTPRPKLTEQADTAAPTESAPTTDAETSIKIQVIKTESIPGLLGTQWYEWDKVGAYPGASAVQCGDRIAFQMLKWLDEHSYDSYLSFADPDGSHCVTTKIKDSRSLNYKDGWVYIIYKDDCIYKVKTDGSGREKIFEAKSSIEGTTGVLLSELLLAHDKLYVFENIHYGKEEKSIFMRMNLDGSGAETIDEFVHLDATDKSDWYSYWPSVFYDSGAMYYTNTDLNKSTYDIYKYDIAANNKTCVVSGIISDYGCKIAARGEILYYRCNEGLKTHIISSGKDELFTWAVSEGVFDFAFFDRWLLMSSDEGLYFYDHKSSELYLAENIGSCWYIMPTQNYVYYEPDGYPFLYPIAFEDGTVTVGDEINTAK